MAGLKVRTYTRTRCISPEDTGEKMSDQDLAIPTLESIITHVQNKIPQLNEKEAEGLASRVYEEFKKIENDEFSSLFGPTKPRFEISRWSNSWTMYDRMRYPADYSILTMPPSAKFGGIAFNIVVIHATKCIVVHYVEE